MCVLIVDDEPLIRCLLCDEIAEAGYEVCQAENGDDAARLIQQRPAPFTLLITDIEMPGERDGLAVARLMRRRHPLIPVIYISGRPDLFEGIAPIGENDVTMGKPFQPSAIVQIACRLLGR